MLQEVLAGIAAEDAVTPGPSEDSQGRTRWAEAGGVESMSAETEQGGIRLDGEDFGGGLRWCKVGQVGWGGPRWAMMG